MIILFVKTTNRIYPNRHFVCQVNQLETAFEALTAIAATGDTIVEACLQEEGKRTRLPVEAFDGNPILGPIQELQYEWQSLLYQPQVSYPSFANQTIIELTLQRIDQYETRLAIYHSSLLKFEELLLTTQVQLSEGTKKDRLSSRYRLLISQYSAYLSQLQTQRDWALNRLGQLKSC